MDTNHTELQYRIFITADHGNIAGVGIGATPPKALVESYAQRVALFDDAQLAADYASHCRRLNSYL